jgi:predicted nuclease of predicted toxin-antitoxin system
MSVRFVIDMNLSPSWVETLQTQGWFAVHWSSVGDPRASDREIMAWAVANRCVVLTHDLDFGTTLALTHANGPSVVQVRGRDVLPDHMAPLVLSTLRQHAAILAAGALIVIDERRSRVRILPL